MSHEIPEKFNVDEVGEFLQPRCPQCQSLNLSFEDLNKPITWTLIYFLGLPIPIRHRRWECHSCGHGWAPANEEL
jgi:rubredoxin